MRLVGGCETRPDAVRHSFAGTFHCCAAAATSIWRTTAPTRRSGSQWVGVDVLPPAICMPYFISSRSACSTRTAAQSTSSSSATSIGRDVFTPWPISGLLAMIVTTLSGVIRMNDVGSKFDGGNAWAMRSVTGSK